MPARFSPAIILHTPQLGENIGATARAMLNFGLTDLRLVTPRDGWPNPSADTMSAGALAAGVVATIHVSFEVAIADLALVIATTARPRGMEKPVLNAREAIAAGTGRMAPWGVVFGGEKSGLPNEAVALCDSILTYPVNSEFASLNLAQAAGIFCHAWGEAGGQAGRFADRPDGVGTPASRQDLIGMFEHFETELTRAGYFYPPEKTPLLITNLRNALIRAGWTTQEVRTFRGAIKALAHGRGAARTKRED